MANKLVALFLVCIAIVAALHIQNANANADDEDQDHAPAQSDSTKSRFVECFKDCESGCLSRGHGYTLCEMKCDTDCAAREAAAKLGIKPRN